MKAIRQHARGGPERLVYEDAPLPDPVAGEALLRVDDLDGLDRIATGLSHPRQPAARSRTDPDHTA